MVRCCWRLRWLPTFPFQLITFGLIAFMPPFYICYVLIDRLLPCATFVVTTAAVPYVYLPVYVLRTFTFVQFYTRTLYVALLQLPTHWIPCTFGSFGYVHCLPFVALRLVPHYVATFVYYRFTTVTQFTTLPFCWLVVFYHHRTLPRYFYARGLTLRFDSPLRLVPTYTFYVYHTILVPGLFTGALRLLRFVWLVLLRVLYLRWFIVVVHGCCVLPLYPPVGYLVRVTCAFTVPCGLRCCWLPFASCYRPRVRCHPPLRSFTTLFYYVWFGYLQLLPFLRSHTRVAFHVLAFITAFIMYYPVLRFGLVTRSSRSAAVNFTPYLPTFFTCTHVPTFTLPHIYLPLRLRLVSSIAGYTLRSLRSQFVDFTFTTLVDLVLPGSGAPFGYYATLFIRTVPPGCCCWIWFVPFYVPALPGWFLTLPFAMPLPLLVVTFGWILLDSLVPVRILVRYCCVPFTFMYCDVDFVVGLIVRWLITLPPYILPRFRSVITRVVRPVAFVGCPAHVYLVPCLPVITHAFPF